jgi:hypothetical protein
LNGLDGMAMTKDEFIKRCEQVVKEKKRFLLLWLLLVNGFVIANYFIFRIIPKDYYFAYFLFFCGVLIWYSRFAVSLDKKRYDRYGLKCQHCQKLLMRGTGEVIATGNCGHCGKAIFDK